MRRSFFIFSLLISQLWGSTVDIVTNFNPYDLPCSFAKLKKHYTVRVFGPDYIDRLPYHVKDPQIKKIIFFNCKLNPKDFPALATDKLVHFLWEPWGFKLEDYDMYGRGYTWNDSLVDGKKIFRFNYPYLMPMSHTLPRFHERKFSVMITGRWHAHRFHVVQFFETKPLGEFDFYGAPPHNYDKCPMYKGIIPGGHSGPEKINVLKKYKFSYCFENTTNVKGYITEKLFACFAAGCVPVYFGAQNVQDYIPEECYIDFRKFSGHEELYRYLKTMPESEWERYLKAIRAYLKSEKAKIFSPEAFDELIYQAAAA